MEPKWTNSRKRQKEAAASKQQWMYSKQPGIQEGGLEKYLTINMYLQENTTGVYKNRRYTYRLWFGETVWHPHTASAASQLQLKRQVVLEAKVPFLPYICKAPGHYVITFLLKRRSIIKTD